jgi:hypothetical protein
MSHTTSGAGSRPPSDSYQTSDLDFGAYLIAAESLQLDHIEPRANHSVLVFSDPERRGHDLFVQFNTSNALVNGRLLLQTRNSLLNTIRGMRG